MTPAGWRITAVAVVVLMFIAKFFILGPLVQISREEILDRAAKMLTEASQGQAVTAREAQRADLQQITFRLPDCPSPYVALQALLNEDPQAVINITASTLPPGLAPHVIYLGEEHDIADRFGLKVSTITKFIAYRLGLSPERPAVYIFIVMAAPGCTGYQKLDWWRAWAD